MLFCLAVFLLISPFVTSTEKEQHIIAHARLEKSLFELASTLAKKILNDEVPKIPLPVIDQTFAGIDVISRWVKWVGFQAPNTNFTISESGLLWKTRGGMVKIEIKFTAYWWIIQKTGLAYFTAEDLGTVVQASVHNQLSRPQIDLKHCSSKLGDVTVHVRAGITGFFINLFSWYLEDELSEIVEKEACKLVASEITKANKFVMIQPEEIPVWNTIALNYSVIGEPAFRTDAIEASSSFRLAIGNLTDGVQDDEDYEETVNDELRAEPISVKNSFKMSLLDAVVYSTALIGALNLLAKCRK